MTRQVWAMWHGGYSYAVPELSDAEPFDSLAHATRVFAARLANDDRFTPCVDRSSTMHVFTGGHPETYRDPYPDRVLSVGPRGGIRSERV